MKLPQFKVAVSTGLFGIARAEEIATAVKKIGYGLTRGTSAIEISGDVPHEINFTEGLELRYIAEKQGIDLNLHGSLTVPFCIPDVTQWKEAQDHVEKSIKSAVYGGCKYVNFHSCLYQWVERITYAGRRFEIMMGDWKGRFINEILAEPDMDELREYFVEEFWEEYGNAILGEKYREIYYKAEVQASRQVRAEIREEEATPEEIAKRTAQKLYELLRKFVKEELKKVLEQKLDWYIVAKRRGDYVDACKIIAHYLFFKKDPIWKDMVEMYREVLEKFDYDPENPRWLREALREAEKRGGEDERLFKEFYYGVVGAKFLWGHLIEAAKWMAEQDEYKGKGLPTIIRNELKMIAPKDIKKQEKELMNILKNLMITIENPDARDPSEAGRYMLWRPKQMYVAIKNVREELKRMKNPYWDKIFMLIDFEHLATQGVDPLEDIKELVKKVPNVGELIISIHSNHPTPLHSHLPIEIGDDVIYRLLWTLRKAGLGKKRTTYLVFERGGFRDPFKRSVTALRLMAKFLEKDVPPEELPPEFYGISPSGLLAEERQWVTIFQHALDPLKGLIKIPEEEYTFLSRAAIEAGKRPEEWKKEEYR